MAPAQIIYSVVARDSVVLTEFTKTGGNFVAVTRDLLAKTEKVNCQKSYVYNDEYKFNYEVKDGITYLALCEKDFKQRTSFNFISDIKERFVATYGDRAQTAIAFAMNDDFGRVLKQRMEHYNSETDELSKVQSQIDGVKEVMAQNIEKIINRGDKIEMLVQKSEGLNDSALEFQKTSKKLKNHMWWKNIKMMLIIAAVVFIIILILLMVVCSPNFENCK